MTMETAFEIFENMDKRVYGIVEKVEAYKRIRDARAEEMRYSVEVGGKWKYVSTLDMWVAANDLIDSIEKWIKEAELDSTANRFHHKAD